MDIATAKKKIRGSIAPVVTPFTPDDRVDEATLRRLIDWQIESGSHGISVTGTTGEPSALTWEERKRVIAVAAEAVNGRVPFVPGTGTNNLKETLELSRFALEHGADALLVIVPYYNRPTQTGLYRYFRSLASELDAPIIVYNIPGRTGVNLEPTTLARIVQECPNVIGIKESNVNFLQVSLDLHYCGRDFLVFSGIETLCFPMLAVGGAGHISATANVAPRQVAELYNLAAANRWDEARDLHYHMLDLNEALFWETNPGPVKAVLGMMGKIHAAVRPPLALPEGEVLEKLRKVAQQYGLIPS